MQTFTISPNLSVGPAPDDEKAVLYLREHGVDVIFDLRTDTWNQTYGMDAHQERSCAERLGLTYVRMPFDDGVNIDLWLLEAIVQRLWNVTTIKEQQVYLHCAAGISRSPFITVAYLASMHERGFNKARSEVEKKNPATSIWPGFFDDYKDWRRTFHKEGPI